jgi:pseudouridine kinase
VRVLVVGACIVDLIARPRSPVRADTSNEAEILWASGGAARNVAENLRRLGCEVTLVTDVAPDPPGQHLVDELRGLGTQVRLAAHERTGIYLALLRPDGGLDMGFCQTGTERVPLEAWLAALPELSGFDGAVLDANLGEAALAGLAARFGQAHLPYALDPVANQRARRLLPAVPGCALIKPDRTEARVLTGLPCENHEDALGCAQYLREMGAVRVIVTLGAEGLCYLGPEGERVLPATRTEVVDVIGAGDALFAAAYAGILRGLPLDDWLLAARRAAALTCTSPTAVSPAITPELLAAGD